VTTISPELAAAVARVEAGDLVEGGSDLLVELRRNPDVQFLYRAVRVLVQRAR